jgi:hypothetical protein
MAMKIRGSRISRTITAASELLRGDSKALHTSGKGKWTAPIVKATKAAKPSSNDMTSTTASTFRGVAGRVTTSISQ